MGNRRTVILIVAVVVALVAAGAIYSYLNSVQDRAYNNAKLVKVYRVDKDIKKGLPGEQAIDQEYVKSGDIPQQYRPTTALTDINAIRGKVALNNLSSGQIVVDVQVPYADAGVLAARAATGDVALVLDSVGSGGR